MKDIKPIPLQRGLVLIWRKGRPKYKVFQKSERAICFLTQKQCSNFIVDNFNFYKKRMSDLNVILPSKPRIVSESEVRGVFEIDALYPGYGHTLGSSLRRIILSSLPGAAITSVKINGVSHEFSTIAGVKEDVVTMILNLKRARIKMLTNEPQ